MNLEVVRDLVAIHRGYWTSMPEYPGVWLSDAGHFVSTLKRRPRLLKGCRRGKYLTLSTVKTGPYLHTLMCETFYGPRPDGCQVRHLDGNPDNNHIDNLRWGTAKENAADKVRHGTANLGHKNPMAKLTSDKVEAMRRMRRETGASHQKIGAAFGVSTMTAFRAVERRSWK